MIWHQGLTLDKWQKFSKKEQLLMVGTELSRAKNNLLSKNISSARLAYERAIELLDLTISDQRWNKDYIKLLELRCGLSWFYLQPSRFLNLAILNLILEWSKAV